MPRTIPTRAKAGRNGPAGASGGRPRQNGGNGSGTGSGAREAIAGFIRTLEKLDAATPRAAAGPAQTKAASSAPEGK